MFYPQEMTEIELVVPEKFVVNVTGLLATKGVYQQIDSGYLVPESESRSMEEWRNRYSQYYDIERRLESSMKLLDIDEGEVPEKDVGGMAEFEEIRPEAEYVEKQINELQNDLNETQKRIGVLRSHQSQLEPVTDLDIPLNQLIDSKYIQAVLGLMPIVNLHRIKTSLSKIPFVLLDLKHIDEHAVVMLLGTKQHADIIERAARSAYLNPLIIPEGYQGTPQEMQKDIAKEIKQLQEKYQTLLDQKNDLRLSIQTQIQDILWKVRVSRMIAETITHYGRLNYTYIIVGWVITDQVEEIKDQLKAISGDILIEMKPILQTDPNQQAPIILKNKGFFKSFESLVTTYGIPSYQEIDPTFLLSLTFPLLFGAMFGDVGHGAILALLGGVLFLRKTKLADLGKVVSVSGLFAIIFGFLYGSLFGIEDVIPAIWLHPMQNIMDILIVTIIGGIILLSLAYLISMFNAFRMRKWTRLLFANNGLAGFLLYWSLIGIAINFLGAGIDLPVRLFTYSAIFFGMIVMFYEPISRSFEKKRPIIEGNPIMFMIQAFFELFETLISFLSNSLSYVRVGAFAVAHAGLSAVFFILADLVGSSGSIQYWLVIVLGNLFIIGFEGMIVGIQTLRLEYYEFFSKFFTGGGSRYTPVHLSHS